jgi:anti-anti-sigma regulatory factor
MDMNITRSAEAFYLKLDGGWTIERAGELKSALLDALSDNHRIVLDFEATTELDLTALQLFCSAHRASLRLGRQIEIQGQGSPIFYQMVRDAGFLRSLGCHKDLEKSCLWKEGFAS